MAIDMSPRIFVVPLLVSCAVMAQPRLPELRAEPAENGSLLQIRNVASQPLTAYLVEIVDYPGNEFALLQDLVESGAVAPGTEKRVTVSSLMPGTVPDYLKVRAAIYADGSSAGIPEKVKQVLDSRRSKLQTTREKIRKIEQLGDRSLDGALAGLRASERALASSKPPLD